MKEHLLKERDGSTPLDLDQIKGLRFSHIKTMGELDELEDANIQKGLDWLNHQKGDYLSSSFLKKLHKELLVPSIFLCKFIKSKQMASLG